MSKTNTPEIKVRVNKINNDPESNIKANCSATIGESFAIHGIRVIDSAKGKFVAMPGYSYKDSEGKTKFADYFHAVTKEARDSLNSAVMDAYENAINQTEAETEDADIEVLDEDGGLEPSM